MLLYDVTFSGGGKKDYTKRVCLFVEEYYPCIYLVCVINIFSYFDDKIRYIRK